MDDKNKDYVLKSFKCLYLAQYYLKRWLVLVTFNVSFLRDLTSSAQKQSVESS